MGSTDFGCCVFDFVLVVGIWFLLLVFCEFGYLWLFWCVTYWILVLYLLIVCIVVVAVIGWFLFGLREFGLFSVWCLVPLLRVCLSSTILWFASFVWIVVLMLSFSLFVCFVFGDLFACGSL